MGHGGRREGAGRKPGWGRAPGELAEATRKIDRSQSNAVEVLLEALEATKEVERVQVPDHMVRIRAAQTLLDKRVPDVTKSEATVEHDFKPFKVSMLCSCGRECACGRNDNRGQ